MNQYPNQFRPVNQTLAIVSLVLGVLGLVGCGGFTSPVALILGFMARKKAAQNPAEFGGDGIALAGIITGAVGCVVLLLVLIYIIFVFGVVGITLLNS